MFEFHTINLMKSNVQLIGRGEGGGGGGVSPEGRPYPIVPINCIPGYISGTKHGAELLCCMQLQSGKRSKVTLCFC